MVPDVVTDLSAYSLSVLRSSSAVNGVYAQGDVHSWVVANLGLPVFMGDDLGLAPPDWMSSRVSADGVLVSAVPFTSPRPLVPPAPDP